MATFTPSAFFVTGGTLRHDAPSYVKRRADLDLLDGLLRGEFCYVLTARQMGKSSLMVRTATKLRKRGVHVAALDLTAIGQNLSPEQWYHGLLDTIGVQLGLENELEEFWQGQLGLGALQRLMKALREVVLPWLRTESPLRRAGEPAKSGGVEAFQPAASSQQPASSPRLPASAGRLVIFVDEIDIVRSLPFSTDEFFAAIRECYNRRSEESELSRLTFCLLGVATPSDLIRDTRLTPFNIGRRIELQDFTAQEAASLARGLVRRSAQGTETESDTATETEGAADRALSPPVPRHLTLLLERVLYWTNGHPYLTQRLCQALAQQSSVAEPALVDRLCEDWFFSSRARERDDNLIFVRERLLRSEADRAGLLDLYLKVRRGRRVPDEETDPLASVLRLAGVVKAEDGWLRERNRIYYRVFDREWVRANMPQAELRRQVAAFWRGVLRTTGIAVVIVLAMGLLTAEALKQARRSRVASAQMFVLQAEAIRLSGLAGQRFNSLDAIAHASADFTNESRLRDLAIAALALPDLRPGRRWAAFLPGTTCASLSPGFTIEAHGDSSGRVTVYSTTNGQAVVRLPSQAAAAGLLRFSPNSRYLAARYGPGPTNEVIVWDWQAGQPVVRAEEGVAEQALDFSRESRQIALGHRSGAIQVFSLESGQLLKVLPLKSPTHRARIPACVRFHPATNQLAECSTGSLVVQIWNWETGEPIASLYHRSPVLQLDWHPYGEWLAAGCADGEVRLWPRHRTNQPPTELRGHLGGVSQLAFSHTGELLASLGAEQELRLWVPATGRQLMHSLEGVQVESLAFSTDDRQLGFSRTDTQLQLWETAPAREYRLLADAARAADEFENLDFSPDGRLLVASGEDGLVLWDVASCKRLAFLAVPGTRTVRFHPTRGELLASRSEGLYRWPLQPVGAAPTQRFRLGPMTKMNLPEELGHFALSGDGKIGAVLQLIGTRTEVHLFDPIRGGEPRPLRGAINYQAPALSPDGRYLAARARQTNAIHVWRLADQTRVELPALDGGSSFMFSPDGEWLVVTSSAACQFWQIGSWKTVEFAWMQPGRHYGAIAFAPEGGLLAVAGLRSTIELLRWPGGESLATLESPDRRPVIGLGFSRDGRRLAATTTGRLVQVWDLALIAEGLAKLGLSSGWKTYSVDSSAARSVDLEFETSSDRPSSDAK